MMMMMMQTKRFQRARTSRLTLMLFALLVLFYVAQRARAESAAMVLKTHSLQRPYVGDNLNNPYWDYGKNTIIDITKAVRLVPDKQSMTGWLWSRLPMVARSWRLEFDFRIHASSRHLVGDGFAFWYTPDEYQPGQALGFKQRWHGLGILFDTYDNANYGITNSRIQAILNNGTLEYDKTKDGRNHESGACEATIVGDNLVHRARITYDADSTTLSLEITAILHSDHERKIDTDALATGTWVPCFKITNAKLPESGYLGFTALTGSLSANYELFHVTTVQLNVGPSATNDEIKEAFDAAFNTKDIKLPTNVHPEHRHPEMHYEKFSDTVTDPQPPEIQRGSWLGFFFRMSLVFGVVGGILFYVTRNRQVRYRRDMKHF